MTDAKQDAALDPFFHLPADTEWNACIGKQGSESNYLDGYIEAALELADAVVVKEMYVKRDTLAMPILYNARHAVELLLKYFVRRLHAAGLMPNAPAMNHDIMGLWNAIAALQLGDVALRDHIARLERFVRSLAKVDDDGQELRYSLNREGERSLSDLSLVNIEFIRRSLRSLHELINSSRHRLLDFLSERATGTVTPECSRSDLFTIARELPLRCDWGEPTFQEAKARIMARFGLSGRKFSEAVKMIETNREMRLILGLESTLEHLTDEHAVFFIQQWSTCHPPREPSNLGLDYWDRDWSAYNERGVRKGDVVRAIVSALTREEIADAQTAFYIGRERYFSEEYESLLRENKASMEFESTQATVSNLIGKMNLLPCMARGVMILGRGSLAARLCALRPDLQGD